MTGILPIRTVNTGFTINPIGPAYPTPINSFGPDLTSPALHAAVQNEVDQFMSNGGLDQKNACSAPFNPERFQSTDVTPAHLMGTDYKAFNINGELMLEMNPVTVYGAKPQWFDLGAMPTAGVLTANDDWESRV